MTVPSDRPVVVALGGNALLRRGDPPDVARQRANVEGAAAALAAVARGRRLVITHGNGPQVGVLALQSEASGTPSPLDVLGAGTEGMIGYLIEQALGNRMPGRPVATLLTQVVVDAADPAFGAPTKPIGPIYPEAAARRLARERGWTVAADGASFRRVVASPQPLDIVELSTIRLLLKAGVTVVCAGGGGVPVVADAAGSLHGVEAVIDKDLSAALLAERLGASMLVMLTDVGAVERGFGTPSAEPIREIDPVALCALRFAPGSMGPKVDAACRFVEATGGTAAIGSLAEAEAVVRGESGTRIVPSLRRGEAASRCKQRADGAQDAKEGEIMYRTIVLALDGSEGADRAVPVAADLARRDGARVVIAHAQTRALETAIDSRLEGQVADLRAAGVQADVATAHATIEGREADAIAQIAHDHDADLVVIAGRGRSPFVGAVLGSVTQRLLHVSEVPVLVIPPGGTSLQARQEAAAVAVAGA